MSVMLVCVIQPLLAPSYVSFDSR